MGRPLGSKMTPEHKLKLSRAMRKAHALKRLRRAEAMRQQTIVTDFVPVIQKNVTALGKAYNEAVRSGEARGPLLTKDELTIREDERFPFQQYSAVMKECSGIIEQRDQAGRNAHLDFWSGFPHGLSDITFETHRRVARILGVEKQMANGFAHKADELKQVMRNDLLDLANYALFGVMKLDKDGEQYP